MPCSPFSLPGGTVGWVEFSIAFMRRSRSSSLFGFMFFLRGAYMFLPVAMSTGASIAIFLPLFLVLMLGTQCVLRVGIFADSSTDNSEETDDLEETDGESEH